MHDSSGGGFCPSVLGEHWPNSPYFVAIFGSFLWPQSPPWVFRDFLTSAASCMLVFLHAAWACRVGGFLSILDLGAALASRHLADSFDC